MSSITLLRAYEVLDSRGRPTVQTMCKLSSGAQGMASVPSGASTGRAEALELRDGDQTRYRGLGCLRAVANVNEIIHDVFRGRSFASQKEMDEALISLDGTANKSRLGANAILSVSLAYARACAAEQDIPLYLYFGHMAGVLPAHLPRPMINLFSGGKHAGGQTDLQDVLIIPWSAETFGQAMVDTYAVYQAAVDLIQSKYGMRNLTADEGGLAPPFASNESMLEDAVTAIQQAGLIPDTDIRLALDVASSHFCHGAVYHLGDERLSGDQMVERLVHWTQRYPLVSIEDGLAEDDWEHWSRLRGTLPAGTLTLGDDLLCTNPERIQKAIDKQAANALLLKVNQIGTLTEALHGASLARSAAWTVVVSARSGETEDHWLADLAIGFAGDYIKIGSITQSERLAKYNRLLLLEDDTSLPLKG